jgi:hypothetical protein
MIGATCAGPAMALSCLPTDVARTFTNLDAAEEVYVVVHGTLTFDEARLPKTNWEDQAATPAETPIPARLSGRSLTHEGFTAPFDRNITFDVRCLGPWCASAASGSDVLAFVEYREGQYLFSLGPCYANAVFDPDPAQLDQAVSCLAGNCTGE